jgi:hypothetical protein
MLVVNNIHQR